MAKMIKGLKLLSQADPFVEVFQQQTGEWVILGAGELHLEVIISSFEQSDMLNILYQRCLKDLRERFAKVDIQASEPIVPFRETAVKAPEMAPPKAANAPRGTVNGSSSHSLAIFTIRAIPMPEAITSFLQINQSIISRLERESQHEGHDHPHPGTEVPDGTTVGGLDGMDVDEEAAVANGELLQKPNVKLEDFWTAFQDVLKGAGGEWAKRASHVWSFGPNRVGPNLLLDCRPEGERW